MIKIRQRINLIYLIFVLCALLCAIRITYLKVIASDDYYYQALELWTRSMPIEARRGNIYDRNGKLIVGSVLAPTIVVIPKQISDPQIASKKLAKILGVSNEKILKHLTKKVSVQIIKPEGQKISIEQAVAIAGLKLDGVYIVADTVRSYPYQHYLAQVLGIVGIDGFGLTGIEYIYDDYLRGSGGALKIYTDAHGNLVNDLNSFYTEATSGFDIYLTIDLDIQIALERVLDNAMTQYSAQKIIALVMDPNTSEILAMASRPTFNPEHYQDYDQSIYNQNLPIWYSFEPGSTFKILTYAAGLEENVFQETETFNDPGYLVIDGARIKDWKAGGHGQETFREVLQNSCNPGFMTIGLRLGKDTFFQYVKKFGYGQLTGIDLLGESTGIVFNPDKIGNVELATSSFGQGNSATAIQLVNAANAAVNGGYLNKPTILKGIASSYTGEIIYNQTPTLIRQVISTSTSKKVAYSLECVAALGTARSAYLEGYRVGGKTGTAQIAENGVYVEGKYILSFLGMAPMNNPQVSVYIAVVDAKNTIQYGGVVVAPMVKEVLIASFSSLNITPQPGAVPLDARYWIDQKTYVVDNYVGMTVKQIKQLYLNKYQLTIIGNGSNIIAQLPDSGELIVEGGTVTLYTD